MRTVIPTRALALPAALLIVFLTFVASANADIGEKIILRCTHGESLRGFSQKDYGKALKELETSTEEYSDCASLIHQAQLAAAGARGEHHRVMTREQIGERAGQFGEGFLRDGQRGIRCSDPQVDAGEPSIVFLRRGPQRGQPAQRAR